MIACYGLGNGLSVACNAKTYFTALSMNHTTDIFCDNTLFCEDEFFFQVPDIDILALINFEMYECSEIRHGSICTFFEILVKHNRGNELRVVNNSD